MTPDELATLLDSPRCLPPPVRISTVAVAHCQRPQALRRCLESHFDRQRDHARSDGLLVLDDSRDAASQLEAKTMVARLSRRFGGSARYATTAQRRTFADELVAAGLPRSAVEFGLLGIGGEEPGAGDHRRRNTNGANRNGVLLDTLGESILMVDDDIVLQAFSPLTPREGLRLSAGIDPAEFWFFPSQAAALAAAQPFHGDLLAAHERLLGRDFAAAVASTGGIDALDRRDADAKLSKRLTTGGHVIATMSGLVGDCGWGSPSPYLTLPFEHSSLLRLAASEASYRRSCSSRVVIRVASQPCLSDTTGIMSYAIGLDNRALIPPWFPVNRGSDVSHAQILFASHPAAVFGHVPVGVMHAPPELRRFSPGELFRAASGFDLYELVAGCIGSCTPSTSDVADRVRALGRHLVDLGARDPGPFDEFVTGTMVASRCALADQLEQRADAAAAEAPAWAEDVARYRSIVRERLAQSGPWTPLDLLTVHDNDGRRARRLAQRLIGAYGELLLYWPEVVTVARQLAAGGSRLSRPAS